ncbi:MAG: NHLP bacteriocin export ABC transporter permease/ATPase subunit [Bacillota bacterium]
MIKEVFENNTSFLLDNPENIWLVCEGGVSVFSVPVAGGEAVGQRVHLFDVEAGQAMFGLGPCDGQKLGLLAVCNPDTRILRMEKSRFGEIAKSRGELPGALLESWVAGLSAGICRDMPPKKYEILRAGQEVTVWEECFLKPEEKVLWVKSKAGVLQFLANPHLPALEEEVFFPVADSVWVFAQANSKLYVADTAGFLKEDDPWAALRHFHHLALELIRWRRDRNEAEERRRLVNKEIKDREFVQKAVNQLTSVTKARREEFPHDSDEDPLLQACRRVGEGMGIAVAAPPRRGGGSGHSLEDIARASHIRVRRVILKGDWWSRDNGPFLAYMEEDGRPVALVPARECCYEVYDPLHKTKYPLNNGLAWSLKPFAYVFYRPFPARALSVMDLLTLGLSGRSRKDMAMIILLGIAGGILGMLTPVVTGILFDSVIPSAERGHLFQITAFLLAGAVAGAGFQISQSIAMLRLEGKIDSGLQSAIWDRLLNMPAPFFRRFSTGDLASRANSISSIIRILSGSGTIIILYGIFSFFNLGLLFFYDAGLARVASGLVILYMAVFLVLGYLGVRYSRKQLEIEGKISGLILQVLGGIAKFRVAGAENRAFYLWSKAFSEQRKFTYQSRTTSNYFEVFNAVYPLIVSIAIFSIMGLASESRMSTGQFLAFIAAFSGFLGAMAGLTSTIISSLSIVPLYERLKPILETPPEVNEVREDPGSLTGEIEISRLFFRYHAGGPMVLQDISLHIRPGEFVAVVGPSGSGKSTLLRLLLGFETPESGAVYYNGEDLAVLDVQSVRRQLGVVLQNSRLLPGSIFSNIVGSLPLTMDDAWEAAAMAGLAEDIQQMPMGMHTVITEGSSTLSGGQRQRLLIARAIVNNPRIIFFDEATSALDNRTQAVVSQSLEGLNATRVVIAHRLSTIINADCIYVMDQGKIVQRGTYNELINQEGVFAQLAKRQLR